MNIMFSLWAFLSLLCGVLADTPIVAPGVPGIVPGVAPGVVPGVVPGIAPTAYNPYYNPTSANAPILSYSSNLGNLGIDGSYSFSYTTGDKQVQETGYLKDAFIDNNGEPQGTQVKEGGFGYISPEGTPIQVNYVADEKGFRPAGIHIPADGRGAPAPLLDGVKGSQVYDPRYNPYDPYNRRGVFGNYNPLRPYDPRFTNDPRYNLYNPYRVGPFNKVAKKEAKENA